MEASTLWTAVLLVVTIGLAATGGLLFARAWPLRGAWSADQRRELADAPMPILQRRAWWSLLIGVLTLAVLSAMVANAGAVAYWEDNHLRVLGSVVFVVGLAIYAAVLHVPMRRSARNGGLDERDRSVLGRAPVMQSAAVLIALAAWVVALGERYHDQGAVPTVYLYLIFGSVVIVSIIGQSVGILIGYWTGHAKG